MGKADMSEWIAPLCPSHNSMSSNIAFILLHLYAISAVSYGQTFPTV